jgi:hypothetical protein
MPTVMINRPRNLDFVQSMAENWRSLDYASLAPGYDLLGPGMVLGLIASGAQAGYFRPVSASATDGSQIANCILAEARDTDASDFDGSNAQVAPVVARAAEVRSDSLLYDPSITTLLQQQTLWAALASVGIIVRIAGGAAVMEPGN